MSEEQNYWEESRPGLTLKEELAIISKRIKQRDEKIEYTDIFGMKSQFEDIVKQGEDLIKKHKGQK